MARTWASVNVPLSDVPRWPEVPNETGPFGSRRYAAYNSSRSTSIAASGRVPAEGLTRRTLARTSLVCGHAAADQPRRAVPGARERAPDGPRGEPRDARRLDGAGRSVRLRAGHPPALRTRAAAAAPALAAGRGPARARPSLLGRGGGDRPRLPRARDGAGGAGDRRAARRPGGADHVAPAGSRAAVVGALRDRGPPVRPGVRAHEDPPRGDRRALGRGDHGAAARSDPGGARGAAAGR